ncbi:beta-galactosidase [Kosmotoga arenicorallina S304]|uniref:Beta-galactosidase n=1 Tax=Kosmotoga arenicorallina S304 TaxID=1453497 RepID=A0A176JZW3_9BACT|nr:beta-galactosidase [Kosmotoga arenicorallina]OAA29464.1 beta-galactosidase [Kosmotoga arenicorallina S304]
MKKLFGACYYPEHWEPDRIEKDVEIMKTLGFNAVRIGEFAWSFVEPSPGEYDFSLFDRVIETFSKNGIGVIMGTPTATPPAWLVKSHPEILQENESGHKLNFGSRRHYCFNSLVYRKFAREITRKYAERYGKSDTIIAWQIDNEYGCHNSTLCYCDNCAKKFRKWLKDKYHNIEALNKAWGTVFWSQQYRDWEEIDPPRHTIASHNPSLSLDYMRFSSDSAIEFHREMAEEVRKYSSKPITHNLMVNFTEIDYYKLSKELDFVSWDNYIPGDYDYHLQGMNHDLMRSLKNEPFLVMEQQPGRVNWRKVNNYHDPEQLKYWIAQSMAHGAFGSLIFRYRQLPYGAEQYHSALLNYDGSLTPRAIAAKEGFKAFMDEEILIPIKETAIYIDYENFWIDRTDRLNNNFSLLSDSILIAYKALRELGYNVDFVFPEDDISEYKLLFIPSAYYVRDEFLKKLSTFNGKLIVTAMTSSKDEYNNIRSSIPYGLEEILGVKVVDFGGIEQAQDLMLNGKKFKGKFILEVLKILDAETIGDFLYPYEKFPAVTRKGNAIYIASIPEESLLKELLLSIGFEKRINGAEIINFKGTSVLLNPYPEKREIEFGHDKIFLEPFFWKIL